MVLQCDIDIADLGANALNVELEEFIVDDYGDQLTSLGVGFHDGNRNAVCSATLEGQFGLLPYDYEGEEENRGGKHAAIIISYRFIY
ncbi:hypothetical protein E6Q11_00805 [Candidatus Dojkabacteria bacterium]|uniref:Uncharacterized protein n=1 Tax=Candidatus Dojkabacteria bacterium TaxID=2099670 RepID=A0A5C7JBQ7_9BACT|nr:MAG: hypothetical protein E6Q11_00805 [Candidatus Dojkabacteria bacterium]